MGVGGLANNDAGCYCREIHYHFNLKKMKEIADWIEPNRRMWDDRLTAIFQQPSRSQ